MSIIILLLVGLVSGWLASLIMKGRGLGVVGDIIVGIIGAIIGNFVFGLLGFQADNIIGQIISATLGAVVLLFIISFYRE